ncbi:hypothetical protein QPK24_08475 [Paenibacillus polygoni]|uniref:Amidase n=1 Tax=Paenibacillus polygoni TaxID=3050112 RepID=A0ABY8X6M3_9BACL|nr:hypothetical protein [Paenibacillus polygoni]WIV20698.1 hypothetical protein QPK24_08475 [Paenibacillus polygoni]
MWRRNSRKLSAMILATVIAFVPWAGTIKEVEATGVTKTTQVTQSTSVPESQTATWLWDATQIKTAPDSVLTFAKENNINVIYLQINRDVRNRYYQSFIHNATLAGIKVEILDGRPSWGLTQSRQGLVDFIDWIENYQNEASETEKFSGIHVDIEPHVLPEWKENVDEVVRQWQSNVSYLTSEAKRLHMEIGADIPFWLDNYTTPDKDMKISSWMIRQYDSVTVMAYRDKANAIYDVASGELAEASALGKKVSIAVETNKSNEGDFITFYEEGPEYMAEQLALVEQKANIHSSYAGISIHEYASWLKLASR